MNMEFVPCDLNIHDSAISFFFFQTTSSLQQQKPRLDWSHQEIINNGLVQSQGVCIHAHVCDSKQLKTTMCHLNLLLHQIKYKNSAKLTWILSLKVFE